jgi:hypothetical protein
MPLSGLPKSEQESIEDATRRAKTAKLAFDPKERSAYIKTMIARTLEFMKEGKSVAAIKERLPEFAMNYEHLFDMITSPEGFDMRNLELMISMLDTMGKGKLSQHDASVVVGKQLYEKFGKSNNL